MKCHDFLQKHCLSCDLLSYEYLTTIKMKEEKLLNLFPLAKDKILPSIFEEKKTIGSRNKAKLSVVLIDGEIQFGFMDSDTQFKKLENCPLHAFAINDSLSLIKKLLLEFKIFPYDLQNKSGELKFILITYSESTDQLLIRFILRSKESLDRLKKMTQVLVIKNSKVKVVTANIQKVHQAILEGDEEIVITEEHAITHNFQQAQLFQGPRSFFQTNTLIAEKLYSDFQNELSKIPVENILDLYCGVGAFSFYAKKYCKRVVGIEISSEAIKFANYAKEQNKVLGIDFKAMDTEAFLKINQEKFQAIIVNPPRRGLNEEIIKSLIAFSPEYIFYSSCDAETLARDCNQLNSDYQISSMRVFDMFPFTSHFETLMVLIKK